MVLKFRALRADEIDVRVAQVSDKGCQLLLYKDARCDMNILDETVGPTNWQRIHARDNANCIVEVWDDFKNQWIAKEDTGTESNTEKEKGLASDSFKRACVNWGIGRELYTSPFIWISSKDVNLSEKNGKKVVYDKFSVEEIKAENGVITGLSIKNEKTNKVVYTYGDVKHAAKDTPENNRPVTTSKVSATTVNSPVCSDCGKPVEHTENASAQDLAKRSKAKFGRVLCVACGKEEAARLEASKIEEVTL